MHTDAPARFPCMVFRRVVSCCLVWFGLASRCPTSKQNTNPSLRTAREVEFSPRRSLLHLNITKGHYEKSYVEEYQVKSSGKVSHSDFGLVVSRTIPSVSIGNHYHFTISTLCISVTECVIQHYINIPTILNSDNIILKYTI